MSKVVPLKTSRFDFSLPPSKDASAKSSKSRGTPGTTKECYYYYVYRKKINPNDIKGPEDLPIPLMFRRNDVKLQKIGGSLDNIHKVIEKGSSLSPMKTTREVKGMKRSNSLPTIKNKKSSPKDRRNRNIKLKPIKKGKSASKPLPNIDNSKRATSSPLSATLPRSGAFLSTGKSVPSLLKLSPEDGLQWSRHTTIITTPLGVIEKTLKIETKKVKKDGKWKEEVVKTKTVTDPNGSVTTSKRNILRDMKPEEIRDHLLLTLDKLPATENHHQKTITEPKSKSQHAKSGQITKSLREPTAKATTQRAEPNVSESPDVFSRQVLEATNACRNNHGVPPMKINSKLTKLATEWAERLAKIEKMQHGDKMDLGENIYCKTSSQPWFEMSGAEVVENWYQEIEDHTYDEEPIQGFLKTGHFTQLIWEDSKEMGVAFARNKNGHMAFVVAYFYPKGNWIGEFRQKVPPPGKFLTTNTDTKSSKIVSPITKSREIITKDRTKSLVEDKGSKNTRKPTKLKPIEKGKPPKNTDLSSSISRSTDSPEYSYSQYSSASQATDRSSSIYSSRNVSPFWSATSKKVFSRNNSKSSFHSRSNSQGSLQSRSSPGAKSSFRRSSKSNTSSPSHTPENFKNTLGKRASVNYNMSDTFEDDFLYAHNQYRDYHKVKPLKLNKKLSTFAQEWATKLSKRDIMEHRDDNPYGENIYMKWSSDKNHQVPGSEPVKSWYEEINEYEFGQEPIDLRAGHFTQMIWAETEEVGVGTSRSSTGKIYIVANYDPPGNYVGQFSRMVRPPS